jgi:hypothetical protein
MLKKTIAYTNLDGVAVEEDFYFHLSKLEITKMEMEKGEGGLSGHLRGILETKDAKQIISAFEDIIGMAYGVRSEDGKRFIKNDQLTAEFRQTEAYSQLFYNLVTNAEDGAEFIRGILPSDVNDKIDTKQVALLTAEGELPKAKSVDEMSVEELMALSQEEFIRLVGTNARKMTKDQLVAAMHHKISG